MYACTVENVAVGLGPSLLSRIEARGLGDGMHTALRHSVPRYIPQMGCPSNHLMPLDLCNAYACLQLFTGLATKQGKLGELYHQSIEASPSSSLVWLIIPMYIMYIGASILRNRKPY